MFIYKILSIILYPILAQYIFIRAFFGKEDRSRILERFGFAGIKRGEGDIIWIHAVSVGETNSALILVDELLKNSTNARILFTTTTITSAAILSKKIAQNYQKKVIHQFLPIDINPCVNSFLSHWKPKIALFVESEIWPNLIYTAQKKYKIPVALINARMSKKSSARWFLARKIGFKIFDSFSFIIAQTLEDKARFAKLTNQEILFYGNLKSQAANLSFDENELQNLQNAIAPRKFWLAASTHKGEEEKIIAVHKNLRKKYPDLLTILVPRHPVRAPEIKALMASINFSQRSQNQKITNETEIYFVDTLGELGLFYKLANFAFIGGSLADVGGHNPFEAIKLNCAIISGNHFFNFEEIYKKLEAHKACKIVFDEIELCDAVDDFFANENLYKTQLQNAVEVIKNTQETAQKIVEKIARTI